MNKTWWWKKNAWILVSFFFLGASFWLLLSQSQVNSGQRALVAVPAILTGEKLTYVDAKMGFSLQHPAQWQLDYSQPQTLFFNQGEQQFQIQFDYYSQENPQLKLGAGSKPPGNHFISQSEIFFMGEPLLKETYGDLTNPITLGYNQGKVFSRSHLVFLIQLSFSPSTPPLTATQVQEIDKILTSFQFVPIQRKN